jgi:hypothetical protein
MADAPSNATTSSNDLAQVDRDIAEFKARRASTNASRASEQVSDSAGLSEATPSLVPFIQQPSGVPAAPKRPRNTFVPSAVVDELDLTIAAHERTIALQGEIIARQGEQIEFLTATINENIAAMKELQATMRGTPVGAIR